MCRIGQYTLPPTHVQLHGHAPEVQTHSRQAPYRKKHYHQDPLVDTYHPEATGPILSHLDVFLYHDFSILTDIGTMQDLDTTRLIQY